AVRQARSHARRLPAGSARREADREGRRRPPQRLLQRDRHGPPRRHDLALRRLWRRRRPAPDDGPVRQADPAADGPGKREALDRRDHAARDRRHRPARRRRARDAQSPARRGAAHVRGLPEEAGRRDQGRAEAVTAPFPSGEQVELTRGDQRAVVVEVGGGLRSYAVGEWEVLDGYAADERISSGRGQVLIPWPNRLRDGQYEWRGERWQVPLTEPDQHNAIHGFVRWLPWRAAERATERVTMACRLHPQPGWPFTLDVEMEYALSDDGLSVRTRATNAGGEPCPFAAGAHPYVTV